jgi:post-segregation antitoxin (ccd killing protein)
MDTTALAEAIAAAGGVSRLAERLGLAHPSVARWQRTGRVPADRVAAVEAATGVPRHRLRPDLFQAEARPAGFAETQAPFQAEARALGLDAEAIAARAVQAAIRAEKGRRWIEENAPAIAAWNAWVDENELPLARHRMF